MQGLEGKVSKQDPAVFYWTNDDNEVQGILATHVDDFLFGGTEEFESNVIDKVRKEFVIGNEESCSFKYTGLNISGTEDGIGFDQNFYTKNLEPIFLIRERALQKDTTLSEAEKTMMRAKVGQLLWIGRQSRPDILFDTCDLASRIKNGIVKDMLDVNKVIKRAMSEKMTLIYRPLQEPDLLVYSDSSLGNMVNGGTQGGYLIGLLGKDKRFSPLSWGSRRVRRVVRSTLAGETLAMADAVDNAVYISTLYSELMTGDPSDACVEISCLTDCKSLYEAVKSQKFVTEKRLRIEISGLKESLEKDVIHELKWISTKEQLADCLTKKGASSAKLMNVLESGSMA